MTVINIKHFVNSISDVMIKKKKSYRQKHSFRDEIWSNLNIRNRFSVSVRGCRIGRSDSLRCFLRFLYLTESSLPSFKVRGLQMSINFSLVSTHQQ